MVAGRQSGIRGDRVRRARQAAGYTKTQIAGLLGIPKAEYRAYEMGAPLPQRLVPLLCAVTRCSPVYFETGEGFESHRTVYLTTGNISTRLNMCGKPCSESCAWCTECCNRH